MKREILSIILGFIMVGILNCLPSSPVQADDKKECPLAKYCSPSEATCSNFERFDQLVFNYTNCSGFFKTQSSIFLLPNNYPLLDLNTFDLFDFIKVTVNDNLDNKESINLDNMEIKRLSGIVLSDVYHKRNVQIDNSKFFWIDMAFYTREEKTSSLIKMPLDCSGYQQLSIKQKRQIELFWNSFDSLELSEFAVSGEICPLVFTHVNMLKLYFGFPLLEKHLVFEKYDKIQVIATINELVLSGWKNLILDKRLINPSVFANTKTIDIDGASIKSIELDLFKDLTSLRLLKLGINNVKSFYHSKEGGTKWMQYLNYYQKPFDMENKTSLTATELSYIQNNSLIISMFTVYTYSGTHGIGRQAFYIFSDEDFCLFDKFPFERLVTLQYDIGFGPEEFEFFSCSCTIIWLYKYYFLYQSNAPKYYLKCMAYSIDFEKAVVECDFSKRKALCDINSTITYTEDLLIGIYYLDQVIKQVKMVVLSQVQSVVSFVGVLSNILAMLVILYNWRRKAELINKQKNKSEEVYLLKEPLYQQMLYSSVANSLYCLLFFLNSVIPCDNMDHIQATVCFNKDLGISIVLSFLKLVSNFCLLQMSVHRYLLVGKEHNKILRRIGNIRTRTFMIVVLVVSAGVSSITYFEQTSWVPLRKIDHSFDQTLYLYQTMFQYYNTIFSPYLAYSLTNNEYLKRLDQVTLVFCLVILSDLFSYFLYCLFSLVLDLITIRKLKQTIKEKEKTGGATFDKEKFTQVERKGITMVVLSSLFNFLLRMPELASIIVLYYLVIQGNISVFFTCIYQNDCVSLVSISDVFYMLSISTNLVFYVKFNSNFHASFMKLINRATCRRL